jgi:hypothetical protein
VDTPPLVHQVLLIGLNDFVGVVLSTDAHATVGHDSSLAKDDCCAILLSKVAIEESIHCILFLNS